MKTKVKAILRFVVAAIISSSSLSCFGAATPSVVVGNVANLATMNVTSLFSVAGVWTPNGATDTTTHNAVRLANSFYAQIALSNGRNGLVLNGWSYAGWDNKIFYPVSAVILEQNSDGTLTVATNKYLSDAATNGSGSVVVADFNGDGKPDIFLAAHNESPMVAKASTAYLSNASGTFNKVTLNDRVEAHDAYLAVLNGIPTVFTAGWDGDPTPYYQYVNGQFVETQVWNGSSYISPQGFPASTTGGINSIAVADFDGNGQTDVVLGDFYSGPGTQSNQVPLIAVYKLSDWTNNTGAPEVVLTPYFNGKPQYANIPGLSGLGQTHTYRLWTDDFNHDGKPDILAGGSLWPSVYSMLQMLQNTSTNGATSFVDKTDTLNSDYNVKTQEVDYSMQMLDTDHSGINTYFIAGSLWLPNLPNGMPDNSLQDNYILLNDGTGKLHIYMHDQFQNISNQIYGITNITQHRFIEYLTPDNKINFVAVSGFSQLVGGKSVYQEKFTNVPLQLDPTVDYKENITISDRNGSKLIRTWAGDDTIYDTNAAPTARIDGGLGTNKVVYSKNASAYQVTHNTDGSYTVSGNGQIDTLVNIQLLQFADGLLLTNISAQAVEFYNTNLDNYFITADSSEATAIDNGSAGPGWKRTGNSFKSGGNTSVCRFYGSQSPGPNSHFYTADAGECNGLKQLQASTPATQKRWNYEGIAFSSTPPANGSCLSGTVPVYRAYNNGSTRGVDSNHRITSSLTAILEVVTRGWNNEGVVMCAPQ